MVYRFSLAVRRAVISCLLLIFTLVQTSQVYAQATQLTFSGAPTVTVGTSGNTGSVNTKARWVNVATVNGMAVDMEAVILANSISTANSVSWSTTSGQAKVSLVGEGDQSVDLAYHFYQTGTTTPVVVAPEVIFRGLDGGLRQEVIQTLKTQIAKYTIDSTSSITVTSVLNGAGASDDEFKFTSTAGANLVTNPGFESGNTGFTSSYSYLGEHGNSNSIAMGSWGEGKYAWFNDNRTPHSSNTYFNTTIANNGDAFLVVDIGNDTTNPFWRTSLSLTAGKNYVFSAFLANINDSNSSIKPNVNFVLTNSGGTSVLAPSGNLNTGGSALTPWQEITSSFTASVASNTLALISNTPGLIGNDLAMDDVEVREVLPENQTGLALTLQPASVFYFTYEKSNGLAEFSFDGSLVSIFSSPQATLVDTTAPATPSVTSLTTTDTTPLLSGSAEAYSTVTLTAGGATFATAANGSGAWSVDTGTATPASGAFAPLTNSSANSLQVVSTDAAGNASSPGTGSLIIQVPAAGNSAIAPSPSTIAATGNATSTITVQAKNASNANLTAGGSTVVLSTNLGSLSAVTDNGNGTYTATLTSATAAGTATISGTINGQAMTATTVNFVAMALAINTVAGDDAINLSEDDSSVSVTGTSAGVEAGRTLTLTSFSALNSGNFSAPQVTGAGSALLSIGAGYLAMAPSWGATTNIISTRASVGPQNLTGANYSVDVWLPAAYVTNGQLTVQPYLQDSSGRTAAITQRSASSLTGNSWNTLSLNNLSLGSLTAVASGFDLTAVAYLGLQLNANGKPTSIVGDVRWDNLLVSQPASGSPVSFTFAASQTYLASIGADGSWTATIPALDAQALAASSLLVADVSNTAGDIAPQARRSISHTVAAPVITIAAVTGDDSVSTSEDDAAVSFTGTTTNVENGQTVTLSLNGTSYTGTVSGGSWSVSVPGSALQVLSGTVAVTANVANQAGDNASQAARNFSVANDAPVITLPTAPVVAEDSSAVALSDDVAISDAESHSQTLTITVSGGTVSLSTAGLTFNTGDGSNDASLVFSGILSAINTALDNMSFTPTANLSGTNAASIQIASNDGNGGSASQTLTFSISALNDAPTIIGTPATSVNQGSAYAFTPTGADVDTGDTLTYSIANKPSWASFNTATGVLSGTPGNSDVGTTAGIVITVSDNHGATTNLASFSLTVNNTNDAPTITGTPATSVNQGSAYSFTPTGADVDTGDTLTFSIANKPSWASFNTATGVLSGTPGNSDVGTTAGIVLTVSDNHGATTNLASFSLTVNNTNDAPTISGTPATSVNQGSAYSFTPTGADVDTGNTLTYSIANKPSWASFNTATGQLSGTPGNSDVGTTAGIVITVSDNHGATTNLASFSLTVNNTNDAPTITGTPATSVNQGSAYSFTPTGADVDTGDTLTYSIANKPSWASFNTATGVLSGTPGNSDVGTTAGIVITVSDNHGATTNLASFSLTVNNTNDAPTITGTPATSVNQGSAYSFTPTGADVDTGDTLTYSIANKPSWASFNTATGQLSGTPGNSDVGTTAGIVITVSDNHGATTNLASFSLTVNNTNDAPTISGTPATSVNQGSAYSFTPTGADVDTGDTLTYSIANKPSWASFNTATGVLSGTPGNSDVGTTAGIVITVSDNHGATTNLASFSLTVNNTNDAPTISGTPATSVNQGSAYSFTPTGADVDTGDTLTYSIANKPSWASFNTATGVLSGTPGNSDVGTSSGIVITVNDGHNSLVALPAFSITVVDVNDAPSISGSAATSVAEDSLYSFSPTASDPDSGDTLTFSIANKPAWASFNTGTGVLSGTPGNSHVGTTSAIVISVSDGTASAALAAFNLAVTNSNDAPVITLPPAPAVRENDGAVALDDGLQLADDDGDTQTLRITVTGGGVTLPLAGLSLLVGDGQDDQLVQLSGTLADINTALDAMTFTPTANLSGSQVASIELQADDGQGGSASQTLRFDISTSLVPLVSLPSSPAIGEDTVDAPLGLVAVSDGDQDNQTLTLTVTGGSVSLPTSGLSFSLGDGSNDRSLSFSGSFTAVNAALAAMTFTPDANLSGANVASVKVDTQDDNGSSSATLQLSITGANDAPVISLPASQTLPEDSSAVSLNGSVSLADVDGDVQTLTLTATGGKLDFSPVGVVLLAGDGSGDTSATLVGSISALNTLLAGLSFTPDANLSGPAAAQLRVQTDDGRGLTDDRSLSFSLTGSNDAPVISIGSIPAVVEDQLDVALGLFSLNDADGDNQTITLAATGGSVQLDTTGLSTVSASPSQVVVTGSLNALNAALANLIFNPSANLSGPAAAQVSLASNDGKGGVRSQIISLDITPQNDAPSISGTSASRVAAGAVYTFTPAAADVDAGDT